MLHDLADVLLAVVVTAVLIHQWWGSPRASPVAPIQDAIVAIPPEAPAPSPLTPGDREFIRQEVRQRIRHRMSRPST